MDSCDSPLLRKMKRTVIILLLLLAGLPLWAQETDFRVPDSLAIFLEENPEPDSKRVETLIKVISYCNTERHYDESAEYVEELDNIAVRLNNPYIKSYAELFNGISNIAKDDDAIEAFKHINSSLILALQLPEDNKSINLLVRIYNTLGAYYTQCMMDGDAFDCFMKGLELNNKIGDKKNDYILRVNLLSSYISMKKYKESIEIGKEMLADKDYIYDKYLIYSKIASIYIDIETYDTAIIYYDSAFMTAASERDKSRCLANIGLVQYSMGDYKKSFENLKHSYENYSEHNTKDIELMDLIYLGSIYDKFSQPDSALLLLDKGILIAREINMPIFEIEGLELKNEVLFNVKDIEEYNRNTKRLIYLKDSLYNSVDARKLETLWLQYDFKQTENKLQFEKQLAEERHFKQLMVMIFAMTILGLLILVLFLILNKKKISIKNKDIQLKNNKLKEDVLNKEIESRNRELTAKALVQVERQELLTEMIEKLKAIVDDKRKLSQNLNEVIGSFEKYKSSATPEDFDHYFTQTNPDFYKHLLADFPNLTPYEQHLCAFLRLNLNTKDIAAICNISPDSAKVARARLRKSLNLVGSDADLTEFLSKY